VIAALIAALIVFAIGVVWQRISMFAISYHHIIR